MSRLRSMGAFLAIAMLAGFQAVATSQALPTTTTLAAAPNPAVLGAAVVVTATVSSPGALPASITGQVAFYDGVTPLGLGTVVGGTATLRTSLLPSGVRSLWALYGGNAGYAQGRSASLALTVNAFPATGFRTATSFQAGKLPRSVAMADLNQDGKPDLVVANNNTNNVSVLLGNGNGAFQPAVNYAASMPTSVAVGDFNGDGRPDLAVTGGSNSVSVLVGNGDGTFQPAVSYFTGSTPLFVAIGDFNGDGKADLVVANSGSNTVGVLLGKGDGTFQAAAIYAVGTAPVSIVVGDFNADGKLDLAVANSGNAYGNSGNVSVLLGNGNGAFQAALNFGAGTNPDSIAVGDFNGDGKADLAVANSGSGDLSVLLGLGSGAFQTAVSYPAGGSASAVTVADLNGDGKPDLIAANGSDVIVLLGKGGGAFQSAVSYQVGSTPVSIAAGDLNGDGKPDLAVAVQSGSVSVLMGTGDGSFQAASDYPAGSGPQSVAVGDFNGDGNADLAVANTGSSNVSVLLGNGNGTFQPAANYPVGASTYSLAAGDFDGDGKLDLAVTNGSNIGVLIGNGDGTFRPVVNYVVGAYAQGVAVGDFNADGRADLVVAIPGDIYGNGGSVAVLLGNGDGTFLAPVIYLTGAHPTSVAVGDFNGDGKADLAVVDSGGVFAGGGGVSVLLGNGDGSFQPAVNYPAGPFPASMVVADFNGDGKADLAVADAGCVGIHCGVVDGGVSVLLGHGDGTFQAAVTYDYGMIAVSGIAVGDFNGDGKLDLAVVGGAGASAQFGNGDGSFQAAVSYVAGASTVSVTAGEFNGDGRSDLAVVSGGGVGILLGVRGPALTLTKTHTGNFTQGQNGAPYTVTASNAASADATTGAVTVTETAPAGLTLVSMAGPGWTCSGNVCTRSDALAAGASFPAITVTVNVAANASSPQVNQASVSGGGSAAASATDSTTITASGIAFFAGSVDGGSGMQYLQFPDGVIFGYYALLSGGWMVHADLGYEYVAAGTGSEVYLWDLSARHWFYTNASTFPYLYDFTRNAWLYYFPDAHRAGHYMTNPRFFADLRTFEVFTM